MDITLAIIIAVVAVILSGLFSGSEIAYVQSSKVRMEIDAARGGLVDRIIGRFSRHEDMFISTLLVGNNVVLVIYGIAFSAIFNRYAAPLFGDSEALLLISNTVLSTGIILICGEFMPKSTFRINPNFMIRLVALPLFIIYLCLYPVSWLISVISGGLMKIFGLDNGKEETSRLTIEELDDYLQQSLTENPDRKAEENEVKIFRRAIDFKDTPISKCMTPRNEITAVPIEGTTREQLLKVFITTGLSKVVVYKEDIDDVEGYIHVSELFNTDTDWRARIKPVIFTPESMLANKMMSRMLTEKKSLVIVIDEFGGTAGLVTLEDLVEEIFGEIEDEHDKKKVLGRRLAEGVYEFPGRIEISMLNEEYGFDIKESEEYHTLAGYIIENLQALPQQGDTFEFGNLKFTVLRMSTTRIETVKVEKIEKSAEEKEK